MLLHYIYLPFSRYLLIYNKLSTDQSKNLGLRGLPKKSDNSKDAVFDSKLERLCISQKAADLIRQMRKNSKELLEKVGIRAHNLNNLMTQFMMLTDEYDDQYTSEDQALFSETINRILEEIRQLFSISKTDVSEKLQDRLVLFEANLNDFISESIATFQRSNPRIQVDVRVSSEYPVYISKDDMRSVMDNLLSNAKKASGDKITIETTHQIISNENRPNQSIVDGEYTCITIEDNGIGIPDEIKEQLFGRFVTGNPEDGTGLGLASVKKIVEDHGGHVFAESKTGQDSFARFTILLPHFNLSEDIPKSKEILSTMPPEPIISIGAQAEQYQQWIKAEGGRCYVADLSTGFEFIINAPQNSVVFIEDDVGLAKKIKSARPDIIIILSCDEKPSNGSRTYDSFIPRPVTEDKLIQALSALG